MLRRALVAIAILLPLLTAHPARAAPAASTEPFSPWFIAYGSGAAPLNCRINGNRCDGSPDRPPNAPTALSVAGRTTRTVSLSWNAAAATVFPIAGYDVHAGATGAAPGQFQEEAGTRGYSNLIAMVPDCTVYHDTQSGSTYRYTGNGGQRWSFDDAWSIQQKTSWLRSKGLLGAMVWEMSGDTAAGALMTTLHTGLS
jgi:hypothetical protein